MIIKNKGISLPIIILIVVVAVVILGGLLWRQYEIREFPFDQWKGGPSVSVPSPTPSTSLWSGPKLKLTPGFELPITNISCDINKPCPEGKDLECFKFEGITPSSVCAKNSPCNYYECPAGKICTVLEIYPPIVVCQLQP